MFLLTYLPLTVSEIFYHKLHALIETCLVVIAYARYHVKTVYKKA